LCGSSRRRFHVDFLTLIDGRIECNLRFQLGHDGITDESGWYVQDVEVDVPTNGKHYFFKCNAWLAKNKGDGLTSRLFGLDEADGSVVNYKPSENFVTDIRVV
jgi:hypothetical protein